MKKIMAVSALAVAGMFSAQALADGSKTGFYVTGKAGTSVVSLSDQRFIDGEGEWADRYKGGDDHDTVFSGGVAAGYDFYPQFSIPVRTELEFYARGNADTKYNLYKDDWSRGDLKNEVSVNTLMLNAYYDFRNDSAFTPWVSAGIGYARIHQKTTGISTWDYGYGYSGRESLSRSGSADNFAWSLGAGIRYDVTPDIALDLSYRYLDAGDSSVSYKDEWGDKYKSEVDVKSHDIMLGVTYNF
ncbi:TPA: outer membrane beta-barrel protein [Escherichia coli]|uniref:outer membrane protein n=1 Tax=Escherichia coli TaxID=562 RepID=UPI000BE481FA|nr:outer membrane beta-barrel protein [Escherichia coli]EEW1616111.1 porin family protein [Escherichia coli]EEW1981590.1 porin family protein [Escherichia coli]EFH6225529.1 outer membrane beta-barrel protein [Escherichia coli]EFJ0482373.1 porin family protein [Escherichia coli]EGD4407604.1 porin family protein [Escherichia coli]